MIRESPYRLPLAVLGVLVCLALAAPVLIVIPLSVTQSPAMQWPPVGFTLHWYQMVVNNPAWRDHLVASTEVGIGSAFLATVLGVLTALGLIRGRFPGKRLVSLLVLFPLVVPSVVIAIGMYLVWVLGWQIGSLSIGGNLAGTVPGLILAHAALNLPLPVVTVAVALVTMDPNLELAAAILGASPLATFRRVTAPLIAPGILFGFIFAFLGSWDEFIVASFLSSPTLTTLPVALFTAAQDSIEPTAAAVSTLLLTATMVIVSILLIRTRLQAVV